MSIYPVKENTIIGWQVEHGISDELTAQVLELAGNDAAGVPEVTQIAAFNNAYRTIKAAEIKPIPDVDPAVAELAIKVKNATGKNRSLANQALVVKHFEDAGHSPKVAAQMADEAMRARGGRLGSLASRVKPGKSASDSEQSSNPWKNTGPEAMAARGSYISRMGLPKAREGEGRRKIRHESHITRKRKTGRSVCQRSSKWSHNVKRNRI